MFFLYCDGPAMPMRRILASLVVVPLTMVVCVCALLPGGRKPKARARLQGPGVAVLDFNYIDTSGETNSRMVEHQEWLGALVAGLRADFAFTGTYRLITPACRPAPCEVGRSSLDELQSAAKEAGAKLLVMGAVHKQSTLIQWAKVVAVNLDTDAVVFDKLFSFRGDSAEAWRQAEQFMARDLLAAASPLAAGGDQSASGVKLAVFDFELLDVSAGASLVAESAVDVEQLQRATDEARRPIAQSGVMRHRHRRRRCADGKDACVARLRRMRGRHRRQTWSGAIVARHRYADKPNGLQRDLQAAGRPHRSPGRRRADRYARRCQ